MATVKRFEDLHVWQKARQLCKELYDCQMNGSLKNDYSLKDQMGKSSGSVMDNIAEGFEREGRKEFVQFLSIAKSSAGELRSQLYRAFDRKHLTEDQFSAFIDQTLLVGRMLGALMTYLKTSEIQGNKYRVSEPELFYIVMSDYKDD